MTNTGTLQAVLWDMDGVIVDTFEGHYHAWQRIFEELRQPYTRADFTRTFGMNNRLILRTLLGYALEEGELQRVSNRKEALFREAIRGKAQLLPGVGEWLERFKQMGVKQAVASSAPQANIDALLVELGVRSYFQVEASGAELAGKPDPAVFLLAAERLGVKPAECLVIEDAVAGVEAAKRAGMRCLAVETTNPADKLAGASLVVKDLSVFTLAMLRELESTDLLN